MTAFQPVSEATHSWSYDSSNYMFYTNKYTVSASAFFCISVLFLQCHALLGQDSVGAPFLWIAAL